MTTSVLRHSERTEECFVGIREGSNMAQSEESITRMAAYHPCQSCDCCHLLKKEGRSNLKYFFKTIDKEILIR